MYLCCRPPAFHPAGFPRTRGDVPAIWAAVVAPPSLPPHARGCTWLISRLGLEGRASPARAGMYPPYNTHNGRAQRFPRTRGDVPSMALSGSAGGGLPPHARGCTPHQVTPTLPAGASPARAGMYRAVDGPHGLGDGFPRTRGDVPIYAPRCSISAALPPHARGCTDKCPTPIPRIRASPARAGMYPRSWRRRAWRCGFPRTRGDVPCRAPRSAPSAPLPPHARGCTSEGGAASLLIDASPARAGMYPRCKRCA